MKHWITDKYLGTDTTYTLTSNSQHGICVINFDNANPLYFTITGLLGELTLKSNQQYFQFFKIPFNEVVIRNPYECKFLVERVEM